MKQLLVFIRKEFYHVFRDRRTLLIMFGLPLVQILLFGFALTSEVKNANILVIDHAKDYNSLQIKNKLRASTYFSIQEKNIPYNLIENEFRKGDIKVVVIFPENFGKDLIDVQKAQVQILADGTEPNTAKTLIQYVTNIIADYQRSINNTARMPMSIIPETRMLYNPEGNGSLNFVPGVLALILTIVCTALTSVAVVREKELGTMEILLVSPFKPVMVLIAKAIPYLVLSLLNFIFILFMSKYLLQVPILGSIPLIFFITLLFILASLSFGLLISNNTNSQQVALLISMMGMMLPTIIFTGFIFPLENMPLIFQWISHIIPARWYYICIKAVMLKGLGFSYIWKEALILLIMSVILLTISIKKFKIRLA